MPTTPAPYRAAAVLLAGGDGRRVGADTNKVLLPLAGTPVLAWSLRTLEHVRYVDEVVVVVRPQDQDTVAALAAEHAPHRRLHLVPGGDTRHGSEWNALCAVADLVDAGDLDVVAIHDSARPLAATGLWTQVLDAAMEHGGALPVHAQDGLLPRVHGAAGRRTDAVGSSDPVAPVAHKAGRLAGVQTPQAFRARPLLAAYRAAQRDGFIGTDTASCVEAYTDLPIHGVPSPATNLKITFPEDVALAERLLARLC